MLLDLVEQKTQSVSAGSSNEMVIRKQTDFQIFSNRFAFDVDRKGLESENWVDKYDPFNDERMATCYQYLYGGEKTLREIHDDVANSKVNAARLIYSSWLYTLMTVTGGGGDYTSISNFVNEMKKKGDSVLHVRDDSPHSVRSILNEYFDRERGINNGDMATSVGTIGILGLLHDEGLFEDSEDVYNKLIRKAIIVDKQAESAAV